MMKHLIEKIDWQKIRFALPELIIGIVIGIVINLLWC